MVSWATSFFVAAIVAAVLGLDAAGGIAASLAKSLFGAFLLLFVASVLSTLRPTPVISEYHDGH